MMNHATRITLFSCVCFAMLSFGDWLTAHMPAYKAVFFALCVGLFVAYLFHVIETSNDEPPQDGWKRQNSRKKGE